MRPLAFLSRLGRDNGRIAATEFALIAPALLFLVMGVLEMSFRFRATEGATRYAHQVADLVSRETSLTTEALEEIYGASVHMMKPLDTTANLDLDVSSVGFEGGDATPTVLWRRIAGTAIPFERDDTDGMGVQDESVVRVGVRYNYQGVLSEMFGGGSMAIEKSAYARPRIERKVSLDGQKTDGGAIAYLSDWSGEEAAKADLVGNGKQDVWLGQEIRSRYKRRLRHAVRADGGAAVRLHRPCDRWRPGLSGARGTRVRP